MTWTKLDGYEKIICENRELEKIVTSTYSNLDSCKYDYYRCVCPRCYERNISRGKKTYTHRNLSISKDFSYGRCFRCNGLFFDALLGASVELEEKINEKEMLSPNNFKISGVDMKIYNDATSLQQSEEGREYISHRNKYYDCDLNQFSLRYKPNKIVIPYFNPDGESFFYQLRYIDLSKAPAGAKYFNPPIDNKPLYIAPDKDKRPHWKTENPLILVEGALTAIALKITVGDAINVVALLGKVPTYYQICFLKWLGLLGDIYVMMDESSLSEIVVRELKSNHIKSTIIPSYGEDAEELLNQLGLNQYREYLGSFLGKKYKNKLTFRPMYGKICGAELIQEPIKVRLDFNDFYRN